MCCSTRRYNSGGESSTGARISRNCYSRADRFVQDRGGDLRGLAVDHEGGGKADRALAAAEAEWLRAEVLEPVPHRHVVLTMPRLLRPLFRRRRELLLDLSQCGAEALSEYMRRELGPGIRPGIVVSVASAGDLLQWHIHLHVLATDGAFSDEGTFHPLATWDQETLMRIFRERLLERR